MSLATAIRRAWLKLIKHTLNLLTRRIAQSGSGPFSLIYHTGRRSGKSYATPIVLAPIPGGFMVELTYGPVVDWYKNIVAAGRCTVLHRGQVYVIDQIERVETATGMAAFPAYQRVALRLLRRTHFERLRIREG